MHFTPTVRRQRRRVSTSPEHCFCLYAARPAAHLRRPCAGLGKQQPLLQPSTRPTRSAGRPTAWPQRPKPGENQGSYEMSPLAPSSVLPWSCLSLQLRSNFGRKHFGARVRGAGGGRNLYAKGPGNGLSMTPIVKEACPLYLDHLSLAIAEQHKSLLSWSQYLSRIRRVESHDFRSP